MEGIGVPPESLFQSPAYMKLNLREVISPMGEDRRPHALGGHGWGYVFAIVGTILFSLKAILIKLIYQPVDGQAANALDAITIMAMRLGFSLPVYVAIFWMLLRGRRLRNEASLAPKDMLLAGLLGLIGYYACAWLDIEGLKYITAQLERLLLFTYPVWVFILGALFFGKPLTKGAVMAVILAYLGIAVIFSGGDIAIGENVFLGTAMVLTCAVAFALFQLLAKPMITRLGSPMFTCCSMFGAGIAIFAHFFLQNIATGELSTTLDMPPRIWGLGIALAVFSTLLPSFMVNIAIGRIGPQAVAAMGMMSPVAVIVLAIWWLGEPFGWVDGLGTVLTLLGIGLYTWFDKRAKSKLADPQPATDI